MERMTMDISVIICVHTQERWNDINEAIISLKRQTLPPREIIVVVDHNVDLLKRLRRHIEGIVIIENAGARGLSDARNSGIAIAQSQFVAFLDDDAVAQPDWLAYLTQRYREDPQVLGTGGAVVPLWEIAKPAWFPEEFYWVVGCTYQGMPQVDAPIRNPIGANMSLRRTVFDGVGGFRNDIGRVASRPIGCEETELCIRASQYWPESVFLYHPSARVLHRVPKKRASLSYFCARCYSEGLSKAAVARYVGTKSSLASERTYTLQVLPQGIVRDISSAFFRRDVAGLARAGAIVVGLSATIAGYLVGMCTYKKRGESVFSTEREASLS